MRWAQMSATRLLLLAATPVLGQDASCPSTCYGYTCDYWITVYGGYTCEGLVGVSCNCDGCDACTPPSAPPPYWSEFSSGEYEAPSPATPPPTAPPPSPPLPPLPPLPPFGPPSAPCEPISFFLKTEAYGSEVDWWIDDDEPSSKGYKYDSYSQYTSEACLGPGQHTLTLHDTFGDGWHGGYITASQPAIDLTLVDAATLSSGSSATETFNVNVSIFYPPAAPPPPRPYQPALADNSDYRSLVCLSQGNHLLGLLAPDGAGWPIGSHITVNQVGVQLLLEEQALQKSELEEFTVSVAGPPSAPPPSMPPPISPSPMPPAPPSPPLPPSPPSPPSPPPLQPGYTTAASADELRELVDAATGSELLVYLAPGVFNMSGAPLAVEGIHLVLLGDADKEAVSADESRRALSEQPTMSRQAIIDAGGLSRAFEISAGGHLEMNYVTLIGGHARASLATDDDGADDGDGGAVLVTGGTLTMTECAVRYSVAEGSGGGIATRSGAETTLINVTIEGNVAQAGGGGGMLLSGGQHVMTRVSLQSNVAADGSGGGISLAGSALLETTMVNLSHNYAAEGSAISICYGCSWQGLIVEVTGAPSPPPSPPPLPGAPPGAPPPNLPYVTPPPSPRSPPVAPEEGSGSGSGEESSGEGLTDADDAPAVIETENTSSSVAAVASPIHVEQAEGATPTLGVRELRVLYTDTSVPTLSGRTVGFPSCDEAVFVALSGAVEALCGPDTVCNDEPLSLGDDEGGDAGSSADEATSPVCACAGGAYPRGVAFDTDAATLAPYMSTGCATPVKAMGVTYSEDSVLLSLTKPEVRQLNLTVRIEGTDWRADQSYSWAIDTASVVGYGDWVILPETAGALSEGQSSVVELVFAVELRTVGRAEGPTPYTSSLPISLQLQEEQHFDLPITLIVSADVVAANSALHANTSTPVTAVVLVEVPLFTFEVRDLDGLLLDHGGDSFTFNFVRDSSSNGLVSHDSVAHAVYVGHGVYHVHGTLSHTGSYEVTVDHHNAANASLTEALPGSVRIEGICPDLKEPMDESPGVCGCEPGTEANLFSSGCIECIEGTYWEETTRRCLTCPQNERQTTLQLASVGVDKCVCVRDYYRINPSIDAECFSCFSGEGSFGDLDVVTCPVNSTLETVVVKPGYWRLSDRSDDLSKCEFSYNGSFTPCVGGANAGHRGDGYCLPGHEGPRCEVCNDTTYYFNYIEAQCVKCPTGGVVAGLVVGVLGGIALVVILLSGLAKLGVCCLRDCGRRLKWLLQLLRNLDIIPKLKILFAFYQVVAAMPRVYGVIMPAQYYSLMRFFNLTEIAQVFAELIMPSDCFAGGFEMKILVYALSPLVLIAGIGIGCGVYAVAEHFIKPPEIAMDDFDPTVLIILKRGMFRALPVSIVILFVMIPSISAQIFEAFVCLEFTDDSTTGTYGSYMSAHLGQSCDAPSYAKIETTARVLVVLWPVAMPFMFLMLLLSTRKSIQAHRVTPLSRAAVFLYKEYEAPFYWWEPLEMVRKLVLTGFVLLIPIKLSFVRLIVAELVCVIYLMLISVLKPFIEDSDDYTAIGCNVALTVIYLGASYIKLFEDVALKYGGPDASKAVLGLSSSWELTVALLFFNFGVIGLAVFIALHQVYVNARIPVLRLTTTGRAPDLSLPQNQQWHLFLSHVWSTGQDQVAVIKRQLNHLVVGIEIFLDVDDLEDIGNLEKYIEQSSCILIFLSKGYFLSANCLREVKAAAANNKPVVLVHEPNVGKGGAPIGDLIAECPEEYQEFVFNSKKQQIKRQLVPWLREAVFQAETLKQIGAAVCKSTPLYSSLTHVPVYIPGEVLARRLVYPKPVRIYVSDANPGAKAVMNMLNGKNADGTWRVVQTTPRGNPEASRVRSNETPRQSVRNLALASKLASRNGLLAKPTKKQLQTPTAPASAPATATEEKEVELKMTPLGFGMVLGADHVVADVRPDSQASRSGNIQVGDRLISVNGQRLSATLDLQAALKDVSAGSVVTLRLGALDSPDKPRRETVQASKVEINEVQGDEAQVHAVVATLNRRPLVPVDSILDGEDTPPSTKPPGSEIEKADDEAPKPRVSLKRAGTATLNVVKASFAMAEDVIDDYRSDPSETNSPVKSAKIKTPDGRTSMMRQLGKSRAAGSGGVLHDPTTMIATVSDPAAVVTERPKGFEIGNHVTHSKHGTGQVVEHMEDGRTRITFESGQEYRYKVSSLHRLTPVKRAPSFGTSLASDRSGRSGTLKLSHAVSSAAAGVRKAEERAKEQVKKRLQEFKRHSSDLMFLLVLNKHTFVGDDGATLAVEVRAARAQGMDFLLVHDVDETEDGCAFDRMFQVTPGDLIADNIYSQLAIAWQPPRYAGHNRVSQAMIKKSLGAQYTGNSKKQLAAVARAEMSEAMEFNVIDEESLSRRLSFLQDRAKTRNSGRFSVAALKAGSSGRLSKTNLADDACEAGSPAAAAPAPAKPFACSLATLSPSAKTKAASQHVVDIEAAKAVPDPQDVVVPRNAMGGLELAEDSTPCEDRSNSMVENTDTTSSTQEV